MTHTSSGLAIHYVLELGNLLVACTASLYLQVPSDDIRVLLPVMSHTQAKPPQFSSPRGQAKPGAALGQNVLDFSRRLLGLGIGSVSACTGATNRD